MRGALFFSLKDNVSYEETGTKYKRDREYAGLWVSGDSFCRFTAVYAEQAGDDRKCKIFVFPKGTLPNKMVKDFCGILKPEVASVGFLTNSVEIRCSGAEV